MTAPWIAIPPEALKGEGLVPYPPGDIGALFDWSENPDAGSLHLMPHAGEFLVDVVAIEPNAVHQHCKPDDEIVLVTSGALHLTTDLDGTTITVAAGEMVFIPRGWAGIYRCDPTGHGFVEVAVVPHDYFDTSLKRTPSQNLPEKIAPPTAPGRHVMAFGSYRIVAYNSDTAASWPIGGERDLLLFLLDGQVRLRSGEIEENFSAGRIVVIPQGTLSDLTASTPVRYLELTWCRD